jgi:hypothetical protein
MVYELLQDYFVPYNFSFALFFELCGHNGTLLVFFYHSLMNMHIIGIFLDVVIMFYDYMQSL